MTPNTRSTVLSTADAGEILTLQRAAYLREAQLHDDLALPPLTETLDELVRVLARPDVLARGIRDHGRLIAAVRLVVHDDQAELGRLIVAPDRQGEGIGTALLDQAENSVPATVTTITLFTGERSVANLRLYRRHGYRETHRSPAGHYQLVHMQKPIRRTIPQRTTGARRSSTTPSCRP